MSPSIRITDELKQELTERKDDDETFEELLDRLVVEGEADIARIADGDTEEQADITQQESTEPPDTDSDQ